MKSLFAILVAALLVTGKALPQQARGQTYCNPLNISYRFSLNKPSRRELADPAIVLYKDNYFFVCFKSRWLLVFKRPA